MSGGSSELAEVQEKLELLNTEYDRLNDEWTGRLAAQQDEFQREKYVRVTEKLFEGGRLVYIFRSYATGGVVVLWYSHTGTIKECITCKHPAYSEGPSSTALL